MIRVIKVGGSLFDWPGLPRALEQWLEEQPPAKNYLIAGGGEWVEALRLAAETFALSETFCHQAAIDLMSTSAIVLRELLRDRRGEFEVVDVREFLDAAHIALPASWHVTSDSIAAAIATDLQADELVLLKSTNLDATLPLQEAAARGVVDSYFPTVAAHIAQVRMVNLRATADTASPGPAVDSAH